MMILHLLDHSLPLQSGYAHRTRALIEAQRKMGHQTIHLTSPRQGQDRQTQATETASGLHFYRTSFPKSRWWKKLPLVSHCVESYCTYRALRALLKQHHPDILHVHSPVLNLLPVLLWPQTRPKPTLVYEIRAFWEDAAVSQQKTAPNSLRYRLSRALETFCAQRTHRIVVICQGLKADLIQRGIAAHKILVVPNGVDTTRFTPLPSYNSSNRNTRFAIPEGHKVLGFIGSFYHYEGLHLLVQALYKLHQQSQDWHLILVGSGPEHSEIIQMIRTYGLQNHVICPGHVSQSKVSTYYPAIDLLVYPRLQHRITDLVTPLKPLEAMAQKRAFIASNVQGHQELIQDQKTGYLFQADNLEALVQAIVTFFETPLETHDVVLGQALEFVQQQRQWDQCCQGYSPILNNPTIALS